MDSRVLPLLSCCWLAELSIRASKSAAVIMLAEGLPTGAAAGAAATTAVAASGGVARAALAV
jgi:hypothetical protein